MHHIVFVKSIKRDFNNGSRVFLGKESLLRHVGRGQSQCLTLASVSYGSTPGSLKIDRKYTYMFMTLEKDYNEEQDLR